MALNRVLKNLVVQTKNAAAAENDFVAFCRYHRDKSASALDRLEAELCVASLKLQTIGAKMALHRWNDEFECADVEASETEAA